MLEEASKPLNYFSIIRESIVVSTRLPLENTVYKANQINPIFARHETFHPRFGWLKKGFDRASHDAEVFLREDAPIRLGVGKNMVRSIRYWCSAFKLLENDQPTDFGTQLLDQAG